MPASIVEFSRGGQERRLRLARPLHTRAPLLQCVQQLPIGRIGELVQFGRQGGANGGAQNMKLGLSLFEFSFLLGEARGG